MTQEIYNQVIVVGNLGRDPQLRYTQTNQKPVCELSIGIWQGKDRPTTWLDVVLWNDAATAAKAQLGQGDKARFKGKLSHDEWNDRETGQKRTKLKMTAFEFEYIPRPGERPNVEEPSPAWGADDEF